MGAGATAEPGTQGLTRSTSGNITADSLLTFRLSQPDV